MVAIGLSPRVRGNRPCGTAMATTERSIPASAGEPNSVSEICSRPKVYPRECGGTVACVLRVQQLEGLSPRVRGNPADSPEQDVGLRSIPASAGEPCSEPWPCRPPSVYPRECGGTMMTSYIESLCTGLSPRVRGNRRRLADGFRIRGSIPASAGEPQESGYKPQSLRVYPRECGGTFFHVLIRDPAEGLSPRVRGNPLAGNTDHRQLLC